jgi:hypothetical protein
MRIDLNSAIVNDAFMIALLNRQLTSRLMTNSGRGIQHFSTAFKGQCLDAMP